MKTEEDLDFEKFKKFFLLEFTRQLIQHSASAEVIALQTSLRKEEEYKLEREKAKVKEIIQQRKKEIAKAPSLRKTNEIKSIMQAPIGMFKSQRIPHLNPFKKSFRRQISAIPEERFPIHIQYIKPFPIKKEIELGKIDPLIADPKVRAIECNGKGKNLIVQGSMGIKKTKIILTKEEITEIIQKFSKETKIPFQGGVFRVVLGKLVFLAIISEMIGSKFIIKKMLYPPRIQNR